MTATIILAAGASTRLGRAKQSLIYNGKSLLQRAIDTAVDAQLGPVLVVLGANQEEIRHEVNNVALIVENSRSNEGMATSIAAGVTRTLQEFDAVDDIILMVCDQPFVSEKLLQHLVTTKNSTQQPIVACAYNDTVGVPVLFDKTFFPSLLSLQGEEGGKKILLNHPDAIATIPFPGGAIDIDTAADYAALGQ
jgi:molybdenum cofactor cytidylyltransferase